MEIFAKLNVQLQTKIMVEYYGHFRIVDGKVKPTYILPETIEKMAAVYAKIPKPVYTHQEWNEALADVDHHISGRITYVLCMKSDYTLQLHIRNDSGSPSKSYLLNYVEARVYNENEQEDLYSIYTNRIQRTHGRPSYVVVSGDNAFRMRLRDKTENKTVDTNLYNIVWSFWEDADDDVFAEEDEEYQEYLNEMMYDNYYEDD